MVLHTVYSCKLKQENKIFLKSFRSAEDCYTTQLMESKAAHAHHCTTTYTEPGHH